MGPEHIEGVNLKFIGVTTKQCLGAELKVGSSDFYCGQALGTFHVRRRYEQIRVQKWNSVISRLGKLKKKGH